jgi:protein-S-isoprenylcysteine O-methyltransferase
MNRSMTVFLILIAPLMALALATLGWLTRASNLFGWFLLLMGFSYVVGMPLYVRRHIGDPRPNREERGDRSFWLVQPGFILAIFAAPIEYLFLPWRVLPRGLGMQIAGLLLVIAGVGLLSWARRSLSGQFTGHVQVQAQHRLVQDGAYRLVRHPGYLGYLLLVFGVALGYSSLLSLAAGLALLLPGLVYRMDVEEKLLTETFGDAYRSYASHTKRLIPGVW